MVDISVGWIGFYRHIIARMTDAITYLYAGNADGLICLRLS